MSTHLLQFLAVCAAILLYVLLRDWLHRRRLAREAAGGRKSFAPRSAKPAPGRMNQGL